MRIACPQAMHLTTTRVSSFRGAGPLGLACPLLIASVAALSGCTNEAPVPAFVAVEYQVRCLDDCTEAPDDVSHRISNVDGEDDLELTCEVTETDGDRFLTFGIRCPGEDSACGDDEFELRVEQVRLGDDDEVSDPGSQCEVSVREGSNQYVGRCTGESPTGSRPCEIEMDRDGAFLTGELRCVAIPNRSTNASTRHLVFPEERQPAVFKLEGCAGL